MARDLTQGLRNKQRTANNDRRLNTVAQRAVVARPDSTPASGIYLGTVSAVETDGPNGEQRYTVAIVAGHAKAATGLTVGAALVCDDSGVALAEDDAVVVFVPPNPGPAIIVNGGMMTVAIWNRFSIYEGGVATIFDGA